MRVTMLAPALVQRCRSQFSISRFTVEIGGTARGHRGHVSNSDASSRNAANNHTGEPDRLDRKLPRASQRSLHGNSEKNSVCCRVLADHRIGRLRADVRFNRSSDWSAASAASGVRGAAATAAARVRLDRGLLVSGQTSLRVARRVLDAAAVCRRPLGLCPVRAEHVLRGILGREWWRDRSRSSMGPRS